MRFTPKNQNEENNNKTEDGVDTQLELLKYATQVQSRIKQDITSDFTLCKLDIPDKQGITEMTVNAYVTRRKIEEIKIKAKWYKWNNQEKTWQKDENEEKRQLIEKQAEKAFDMYMTKVMMTAILNRNVDKNYLVNFLKNQNEPQQEEEPPSTEKKIKNKIIKKDNETKDNTD